LIVCDPLAGWNLRQCGFESLQFWRFEGLEDCRSRG